MKAHASILLISFSFLLFCSDKVDPVSTIFDGKKLNGSGEAPFNLEQNYPNPFNPETRIQYRLDHTMHVRMNVYSEDWQNFATLVDHDQSPGTHSVAFDPDRYMKTSPSGDYYYTLEGEGYIQIRMMKLIK
jgi:hypothetical protein